ncbi:MAG: FtsQ-type POTRA domain-containing protein [Calditrichaeota bacterium]|nr:FtsQ-type POTRA domain-containing protein [Calditrichota bacterium]
MRPPNRKKWIFLCLLALAAMSLPLWSSAPAHWAANQTRSALSGYRVRSISVLGTQQLDKQDIVALSGIREGTPLFQVNSKAAGERIVGHPWIRNATVVRRLPDAIELHIEEEIPAALIPAEKMWAITADRIVLPLEKSKWKWDLPILRAENLRSLSPGARLNDTRTCALLAQSVACQRSAPRVWQEISELFWSEDEMWALLQKNHIRLRLGNGTEEIGWKSAERLLTKLELQGHASNVASLDLRFAGRIVAESAKAMPDSGEHG